MRAVSHPNPWPGILKGFLLPAPPRCIHMTASLSFHTRSLAVGIKRTQSTPGARAGNELQLQPCFSHSLFLLFHWCLPFFFFSFCFFTPTGSLCELIYKSVCVDRLKQKGVCVCVCVQLSCYILRLWVNIDQISMWWRRRQCICLFADAFWTHCGRFNKRIKTFCVSAERCFTDVNATLVPDVRSTGPTHDSRK